MIWWKFVISKGIEMDLWEGEREGSSVPARKEEWDGMEVVNGVVRRRKVKR